MSDESKTERRQAAEELAQRLVCDGYLVEVKGAEVIVRLRSRDVGLHHTDPDPFDISEVHAVDNAVCETRVYLRAPSGFGDNNE